MSLPAASFSDANLKLLMHVMKCSKIGDLQTDFDKVATEGGFLNANSARSQWIKLKKKLMPAEDGAESGDSSKTPATPVSTGRKRKIAAAANDDDDEEAPAVTPTKVRKVGAKKSKAKKDEAEIEEELSAAAAIKEEQTNDGE